MILRLSMHRNHLENLIRMQRLLGPTPRIAYTVGLGQDLRICIFNKRSQRKFWLLLPKEEKGMDFTTGPMANVNYLDTDLDIFWGSMHTPEINKKHYVCQSSLSDAGKWSQ